MKHKNTIVICLLLILIHVENSSAAETEVHCIQPNRGSLNGQTRLTIDGINFARSSFNFGAGNENAGNKVTMVSKTRSFPCEIHPDGTHETQVMCYTEKMPEDDYYVRVTVDGVNVPEANHCASKASCCRFRPQSKYTPTIESITPRSGRPGTQVQIKGRIISNRYGSNLPASSNGLSEKLLRVYLGNQNCELKDLIADTLFGLQLNNQGKSWDGELKCKELGTFIGHLNASFIVEGGFGRSRPKPRVLRPSGSTGAIHMFQTYTGISSISHNSGSKIGGLLLTIHGKHFDETTAPVKVMVGETNCPVVGEIQDETVVCEVAAEPDQIPAAHSGHRGLVHHIWNETTKTSSNIDDIITMSTSAADYSAMVVDEMADYHTDKFQYVDKMEGFFVPPRTSNYTFYIYADDQAKLYLSTDEDPTNKVQIAMTSQTSNYLTSNEQVSSSMLLEKGKNYYILVIHRQSTLTSRLSVAVRVDKTEFTESNTGMAVQEKQTLNFDSHVEKETMAITVTSPASAKTAVYEVQTVTIDGTADCTFRFGMYSAFTELLTINSADTKFKSAIEALPGIMPDTVSVTVNQASSGSVVVVTFNSKRGDLPDIEHVISTECENTTTITVVETTKGVSSLEGYQIMIGGVPSPVISVTATAKEVEDSLLDMFSVQCPAVLGKPSGTTFFENFESTVPYNFGTPVSNIEPFCGRRSSRNPTYVFHKGGSDADKLGKPLSQYKMMCLAFKGELSKINVRISYADGDNVVRTTSFSWSITAETPTEWVFSCWDMLEKAKTHRPDASDYRVDWITISRASVDKYIYIDSVSIARKALTTDAGASKQRMPPAKPNGAMIRGVEVTSSTPKTYTITIDPYDCGNKFPLFKLAHGKINSGSIDHTSNAASFTLSNGGSTVGLSITRTTRASVPISGSFKVSFKGQTTESLLPSATGREVAEELQALSEFGKVEVIKEGDCAKFKLKIKWITKSGNQPEVTLNSNLLIGNTVTTDVIPEQNGGLWYDPIPGDLLRTKHAKPQVSIYINLLPSACDDDCNFEWTTGSTPTIVIVTPTQGTLAQNTVITITGTGFDTTASNNTVIIGGVLCTATASTETTITCSVGNGPTGNHDIKVEVSGKGKASGSVQFEYVSAVQAISPTSGSIGGGTKLTITGYGFMGNATVTLGVSDCHVITSTPGQIICETLISASVSGGAVAVIVNQSPGTPLTSPAQYTYTTTAVISAISTTTSKIEGGETITIDGTGFGASASASNALKIGNNAATIVTYNANQVVAILPSNPHGSYPIQLLVGTGYADLRTNSISNIVYKLQVTNISPSAGSLYGGTSVTLTGTGFTTNITLIEIKFGLHSCTVSSASTTQIVCVIDDTSIIHTVRNTGTHFSFGYGYAWEPEHMKINIGDTVHWIWTTPQWVNNIGYIIEESANASTTVSPEMGFKSSSTKTPNGGFKYRFSKASTHYYWSRYVDEFDIISLRGTIKVEDSLSHFQEMSLKIAGYEADYQPGGPAPSASGGCSGTTSPISGCSDPAPVPTDTSKFNFKFWSCVTPKVTNMDLNNGTTDTTISISGLGFGSNNCENEIKVGIAAGIVQTATTTSLEFKIDPTSALPIGIGHMPTLRVKNLGNALIDLSHPSSFQTFTLRTWISGIVPTSGSVAGGTKVTISGSGFHQSTSSIAVKFDVYDCQVESLTYTEIICTTPAVAAGDVSVTLNVNNRLLPVDCDNCTYTYSDTNTPTVQSATPSTVSGLSTSITIGGTLFGSTKSDVTVKIGNEECIVDAITSTEIQCTIGGVPHGTHSVNVYISGKGNAKTTVTVESPKSISSLNPVSGSVNGGLLLTITGNGFYPSNTQVSINSKDCPVMNVTFTRVICRTMANTAEVTSVVVTSNDINYSSETFTYSTAKSPTVTSISPTSGIASGSLSISGSDFSSVQIENTVTINEVECVVTAATTSSITCTLGSVPAGSYAVIAHVDGFGNSDSNTQFTYSMTASGISPTSGSAAGGHIVTVTGSSFITDSMMVQISGNTCKLVSSAQQTATSYVCMTPPAASAVVSTTPCDVVVSLNSLTRNLSGAYTYDAALTPEITGVSPGRGGTAGGTLLAITGTNFGSTVSDVSVTIDGFVCNVTSVSSTQITCVTGPANSSNTKVTVQIQNNGVAIQTSAAFFYIDLWSSRYTWGNAEPPTTGDLVVIPANKTILLDSDTAVLKMLLIQGGKLIFDEKDVELKAENILITDAGLLQVGTEAEPFQHKAIITLYGDLRSRELPIYGTKCLAVREGILDLHGKPTPVTWTKLAATVAAGATQITLQVPVTWEIGDEIIIATTSHRSSQKESERRTIASISANKLTLTLTEALIYEHLGISETYGEQTVDFRAEVGLLTHNVVVRGSRDHTWDKTIKACPEDFDTGEFATQTCFQGRFGEEMGSDQFGAQIMMHAPRKHENLVIGRMSYIEVYHAGQAFRLGRYPIHFHLNGNMNASYVRGLAIHDTFNRAVNIHFTHNVLVEHTVIYNIMGGAFFLEDGIETGNILQYNLAVFVRASSSLLNDDITPAAFWVTNPDNIIQHNAVAGGTHFGFWYRMLLHPDGPSRTDLIFPKSVPLGVFWNNTAHSQGWFGLWIFEDYFPKANGNPNNDEETAIFKELTAWNCEKGAEAVNFGAVQFHGFVLVNNEKAGFEGKLVTNLQPYTANSSMVKNGLIVGHSSNLNRKPSQECTHGGIVLPYENGFHVVGTKFVNFDHSSCAAFRYTRITGTCHDQCGGYTYKVSSLNFTNADNRVAYGWQHEGLIIDEDGSLTGNMGYSLLPTMSTLPPSKCTSHSQSSVTSIPGSICENGVNFHRYSFNNVKPSSLQYKDAVLTNKYGSTTFPYRKMRISHNEGWMGILVNKERYDMEFENGAHVTNISYNGVFYQFETNHALIMSLQTTGKPDRFTIDGINYKPESPVDLDMDVNKNGDWRYNFTSGRVDYIVSASEARKRRATVHTTDRSYNFKAFRCYFTNCIPPPDPRDVFITPNITMPWSDGNTWSVLGRSKPVEGDDVTIGRDYWIILDETPPKLGKLIIDGAVEFENIATKSLTLNADVIIVKGRLVIGWEHTPYTGNAAIILHGDHSSPSYPTSDGPQLGAKAIGVFGGLELHGKDYGVQWTRLAVTAVAGSNQITLQESVNWEVGHEIVIAPTSYTPWDTETFTISAISADKKTLTLNSTLAYKHLYYTETLPSGTKYTMAAEVGHLSRNIKIIGNEYPKMVSESFGARVLVGRSADSTKSFIGFARISNVEFYHTGQEGFTESYDPRFSLAFVDITMKTDMPSYVKKSAFHNGFSPAIGVFGVNDLLIEDNIIHRTVDSSIVTNSARTKCFHNLMLLNLWSGSYLNRREPENFRYQGSIEAIDATDIIMRDNVAAGSERVGFHVRGEACSGSSVEASSGNVAHACLIGVALLPKDKPADSTCVTFSNYLLWKNADFGLYYNNAPSVKIANITAADNQVSIFPMVIGPSSTSHVRDDKTVDVSDSVLVGHTTSFDCVLDKLDKSDDNVKLSSHGRSWGNGTRGVIGLSFPSFTQGSNGVPEKPFIAVMAYQSISGLMRIQNITFARFGRYCGNDYDYAITTSPGNDDGQHPIESQNIIFSQVGEDNKIFYHIPNVGKINSADCIDMDCDGLKKDLITDMDGSLLGRPGAVIPWSEYQWGGDSRRGLNDERIPKVMLANSQGNKIPVSSVAPNKGIIRNSECVFHEYWRAYECHDIDYKMLIIESMDADTETRRLSPVAVLCEGYVDLINGPQDHGWCSGYTCRKRLSTFQSLVAIGKYHDIYFTSTTPQHLRFHLLHANSSQAIRVAVWYALPNRLDVYVNDVHILPKNAVIKNGAFTLIPPKTSTEYMPELQEVTGTNYVSREENMIFLILKGDTEVDIKTATVIIVNFKLPVMSVDDFFGENLIYNLASFLGVDPRKVRIVNVVNEGGGGSRRKRTTETTTVVVEIGDAPGDNTTLSYSDLTSALEKITNEAQLGGSLNDIVNATVLGISTIEPTPLPTDPAWSKVTNDNPVQDITQPSIMEFYETIVPGKEHNVFSTPPKIRVKDTKGNYMTVLGASSSPWQVTATLRSGSGSDSRNVFGGTKTVTFSKGWANFTDLTFSHMGTGYIIDFTVTFPAAASNFSLSTSVLTIPARSVTAHLVSISTSLLENQNIELILDLRDNDTGAVISDIAWRNHSWYCEASLLDPSLYFGSLIGTMNLTFDPNTARVAFQNLTLTAIGTYFLDFHVYTDPAGYDFHYEKKVLITNAVQNAIVVERTNVVEVKLDGVYDASNAHYIGVKVMNHYINMFKTSLVRITGYTVKAGSIIVSLTIEGNLSDMNSTVYQLCSSVEKATSFNYGSVSMSLLPYMTMDGSTFYGVGCGPIPPPRNTEDGLHPGIIAALVILSVVLVIIIVAFIIWKCYVQPKTKTHDLNRTSKYMNYPNILSTEATLFSEKSSTGLTGSSASTPLPPVDTSYILPIDRHSSTLKFKM